MTVRLAIHHREGSFSERWIAYCDEHKIAYRLVNCLDSDIIPQLASVDALLWHWHHQDPRAQLMARQVIMAAEAMGVAVFPNTTTCWHFDDKVAQKYLLEAVGAPLVPTYVFYDLTEALQWIDGAVFPKVFKLRTGAGSLNVRLVRHAQEAHTLARQAFASGFRPVASYQQDARKRFRTARQRRDLFGVVKRLPRTLATIRQLNRAMRRERGYIYFQDFIANNQFDTRVAIIGNRAFAFTRNVRPGDFRASGSGDIVYDVHRIRPQCVRIAFEVMRKVGSQSLAFDFVLAANQQPMIVEVSYSYDPAAVYQCTGHWDAQLKWHQGHMWPQDAILIDLLEDLHRPKWSGVKSQAMDQTIGGVSPATHNTLED
jgi:glutathione synthase/RimK-type ligase-like ATP-grasp enzyme